MPEEIILRPIAPLQKATRMHMKHGAHKMSRISLDGWNFTCQNSQKEFKVGHFNM